MTEAPLSVVVDADAIIAQAFLQDSHHTLANKIGVILNDSGVRFIYPSTAIVEAVTTLHRKFGNTSVAYSVANYFAERPEIITEIGSEVFTLAVNNYYNQKGSKKNTMFDSVVAATAKVYNADAIFSFDKFYKSVGFKLAEELV